MRTSSHLIYVVALGVFGSSLLDSELFAATESYPKRIRIEYIVPKSPEHQPIYERLKERQALEKLQEIFGAFRLPIDLTLRTVGCDGVSNAWYQRGQVSVCYEYLNDIRKNSPRETTKDGISPTDAMVGQFFYVFAHEMGHAIFDLLDVPVFGRSEDAADQFATYIVLQFGKEQARRLILATAYSYKHYILNPTVTAPLVAFSDAHSPPPERFYNLLCLAYGADSELFADFVTKGYLPQGRANGCKREYGELTYAFNKVIIPHLDQHLAHEVLQKAWLPEEKNRPAAR
jgi:Putative metallopeptidase